MEFECIQTKRCIDRLISGRNCFLQRILSWMRQLVAPQPAKIRVQRIDVDHVAAPKEPTDKKLKMKRDFSPKSLFLRLMNIFGSNVIAQDQCARASPGEGEKCAFRPGRPVLLGGMAGWMNHQNVLVLDQSVTLLKRPVVRGWSQRDVALLRRQGCVARIQQL